MVKYIKESNGIKQTPLGYVKGVTLLTADEAENLLTPDERKCKYCGDVCDWWLRSPGELQSQITYVDYDGWVDYIGQSAFEESCVRPVLTLNLNSSNFQIGDMFDFGSYKFKIISNKYALCMEAVGECTFRKDWRAEDVKVYEKSDIKKYIDDWFKECMQDELDIAGGRQPDSAIADEHDFGF